MRGAGGCFSVFVGVRVAQEVVSSGVCVAGDAEPGRRRAAAGSAAEATATTGAWRAKYGHPER
jgi:hypothetical protein